MNFYVILHAIIGTSMVICRPVDVNNDDRPLINYISPYEVDQLVIKSSGLSWIIAINHYWLTDFLVHFMHLNLANCGKRARSFIGSGRFTIQRFITIRSKPAKSSWNLENRCKSHTQTLKLFFSRKKFNSKKMLIGLPWIYHHMKV